MSILWIIFDHILNQIVPTSINKPDSRGHNYWHRWFEKLFGKELKQVSKLVLYFFVTYFASVSSEQLNSNALLNTNRVRSVIKSWKNKNYHYQNLGMNRFWESGIIRSRSPFTTVPCDVIKGTIMQIWKSPYMF